MLKFTYFSQGYSIHFTNVLKKSEEKSKKKCQASAFMCVQYHFPQRFYRQEVRKELWDWNGSPMSVQGRSPAGTTLMPDAVVEFPLLAEGPLKGGPGLAQRQQGKCVSLQL